MLQSHSVASVARTLCAGTTHACTTRTRRYASTSIPPTLFRLSHTSLTRSSTALTCLHQSAPGVCRDTLVGARCAHVRSEVQDRGPLRYRAEIASHAILGPVQRCQLLSGHLRANHLFISDEQRKRGRTRAVHSSHNDRLRARSEPLVPHCKQTAVRAKLSSEMSTWSMKPSYWPGLQESTD